MENPIPPALIALAALLAAGAPAHAGVVPACATPQPEARLDRPLPNVAHAIRHGDAVMIVAIGSSSTQGIGASDRAHSYPALLAVALHRRWPRLKVTVLNKGIGGETADQMLARFGADVLPYRPQLVIWQTGSNSVLKGMSVAAYAAVIRSGLRLLAAAHVDVVLMGPQYAPRVIAKPLHRRIIAALATTAGDFKVAVFHRFAVMRQWLARGEYRMQDVVSPDRLHMNDAGYGCIARLLAGSLDAAARATPLETVAAAPAALPGSRLTRK